MKRLSAKPTVYLLDGSNFAMRFWEKAGGASRDELEAEFLRWLADLARTEVLRASCFRVVFDGPYRRAAASGPSITVYYTDSEPADDMLVERGYFMLREGVRAVIVTSDNGLRDRAAAEGIKTLTCESFQRLGDAELRKETR
jgi:predicted RNA-binding protein with PIN domain